MAQLLGNYPDILVVIYHHSLGGSTVLPIMNLAIGHLYRFRSTDHISAAEQIY